MCLIQVITGFVYFAYFITGMINLVLYTNGDLPSSVRLEGEIPLPTSAATLIASAALYFVAATVALATGITGVIATSNIDRVMALDPLIIRRAVLFWQLNLALYVYYFASALLQAILVTVDLGQSLPPEEVAPAAIGYWLAWLVGVLIQLYFLYIIWSYKATLLLARDGKLEGPYVVKGVHFSLYQQQPAPWDQQQYAQPKGAPQGPAKV